MPDLEARAAAAMAWGRLVREKMIDRYEAAVQLERARQQVRECGRAGITLTLVHQEEVQAAERAYTAATNAIAHESWRAPTPRLPRSRKPNPPVDLAPGPLHR